jgi:hypothetical protein
MAYYRPTCRGEAFYQKGGGLYTNSQLKRPSSQPTTARFYLAFKSVLSQLNPAFISDDNSPFIGAYNLYYSKEYFIDLFT